MKRYFQIKESPEGDWNKNDLSQTAAAHEDFQIKESPEGDWNAKKTNFYTRRIKPFKLKNPRKGTETILQNTKFLVSTNLSN